MKRKELVVDSFAGGGGASLGIERALGRPVDVAINHDVAAIAMHTANHPETLHLTEDVWKVAPRSILRLRRRRGRWQLPPEGWQEWPASRRVGLLWASPDCKHFSRAKGSKPVNKTIRSLAWVIVKWAAEVRPSVIFLENVREFADWGPVVPAMRCHACNWRGTLGQATLKTKLAKCPSCNSRRLNETDEQIPDPDRKGITFKRFKRRLENLGYVVEYKTLNAADYGAPTHRRRLFLVARCDGRPIVWPEPTHGDPKKIGERSLFEPLKPWRTAAECIDWSLPCPSIFDRKRPLAEATMRRIAMGIKRYVLDNPQPFIVGVGGRMGQSPAVGVDQPNNTTTAKNDRAIVTPYLAPLTHQGDDRTRSAEQPMPTTTTAHRGETALIVPTLIQTGYGEPDGQAPRVPGLDKPLGAAVAGGQKHAVVSPIQVRCGGSVYAGKPRPTDQPLNTVKADNRQAVIAAFVAKHFGDRGQRPGSEASEPLSTVTACDHNALVAANLIHLNHGEKQWSEVDEPLRTNTTANHAALVYSFLVRYFGTAIGQHVTEPLFTITGKDRFGLVTVTIAGELYVIVDIGMRMLTPRELARAQGFPDSYELTGTKSSQVARIGNSVCPVMAEALVRANYVKAAAEAMT